MVFTSFSFFKPYRLKTVIGIALFMAMVPLACHQQKVLYQLPSAMKEEVKVEYQQLCDKGFLLYTTHCGGCHNIGQGRKKVIPDFTPEQLKGYELRVMNKQHETAMPDSLLSADELVMISTFLMYKVPSGQPLKNK